MKAVIKTGGKQYLVSEGDVIYVEKLNAEESTEVVFDEVVMVGDKVGTPFVKGATVTGKVAKQGKGKKLRIFTYRAKKKSRKTMGHRQPYTKVEITSIKA